MHSKIYITWYHVDGWSNVVTSKIGKAVITATVQTSEIMYLAWCLLALGFSGHIIAIYLSTLIATNVYALTCIKKKKKILFTINVLNIKRINLFHYTILFNFDRIQKYCNEIIT